MLTIDCHTDREKWKIMSQNLPASEDEDDEVIFFLLPPLSKVASATEILLRMLNAEDLVILLCLLFY